MIYWLKLMVWTLLFEHCGVIVAVTTFHEQEGLMQHITTIGLDVAKRDKKRGRKRGRESFFCSSVNLACSY